MTLLERRRPKDFGRNQQIQIESRSVSINVEAQLTEAQQATLARLLAADTDAPLPLPEDVVPQLPEGPP